MAALEAGRAASNAVAEPPAQARPSAPPAPLAAGRGDERVPLGGLRKKIAEKMVRSKFTMPHFAFVEEVDGTDLVALRKRLNAQLKAVGDDTKLTYLPFIVKAVIAALKKFPHLNANFDEASQELVVRGEYNIGIAAQTPDGLTVAVVRNADRLTLRDLAQEIARLGNAARDRKLKMEELTGGTFLNIESDFSAPLPGLGDRIADTVAVALEPIDHGATFYEKSLRVLVDGEEIPADSENGYVYDELTHSVVFQGAAKKKAFTAKIEITYEEHR